MYLLKEYIVQWSASNVIAVTFLIIAYRVPRLGRILFALLFFWACWLNYSTARFNPDDYLNYATFTPFNWMRDFINGWFRQHITHMVSLISIGQGAIALGLLLRGWWVRIAGVGAIIFLIAILPLGIGSGFPASLMAALAMYFILKRDTLKYIWKP